MPKTLDILSSSTEQRVAVPVKSRVNRRPHWVGISEETWQKLCVIQQRTGRSKPNILAYLVEHAE